MNQHFQRAFGILALCGPLASCGHSAEDDAGPSRPADDVAEVARASCQFAAGALPAQTLGRSTTIGERIPIDHVILVMMENRSFDHYFSQLPAAGQPDVDVADEDFVNPDVLGQPAPFQKQTEYCIEDPAHGWRAVHEQYNAGRMDGFVISNEPLGRRAMGYYDATDLPFYYELASTFAIGDRHFSSLLGPTWPNRMYFYGASSHGRVKNQLPAENVPSIFSELNERGIEWRNYKSNLPPAAMYIDTWLESIGGCGSPDSGEPCRMREIDELVADIGAGDLPPVTFVDPEYETGITETSEHPPGNPQLGQRFVWSIVDALIKSPLWQRSALFITYDEHGGFADHVEPPEACDPGTGAPEQDGELGGFDRYGIRVPVMVVSPYARRHHVSHVVTDHTSILRFVQARFGLPALSGRDANAAAMMDHFDFQSPPALESPQFAEPPVDPAKQAECALAFPD